MNAWSYCNVTDECVNHVHNYFNMNCSTGWHRGSQLDLVKDCKAQQVNCLNFTATQADVATYTNQSWTLSPMQYCVVEADGTETVAHVVFDDSKQLGVSIPHYMIGDVITVDGQTE